MSSSRKPAKQSYLYCGRLPDDDVTYVKRIFPDIEQSQREGCAESHPHQLLATLRANFELFLMYWIASHYSSPAVLDIGGNPIRVVKKLRDLRVFPQFRSMAYHSANPILEAADVERNHKRSAFGPLPSCNHRAEDCSCLASYMAKQSSPQPTPNVLLSVDSVYYLSASVLQTLLNKYQALYACFHRYAPGSSGSMPRGPLDKTSESTWYSDVDGNIQATVRGNPYPYVHPPTEWLFSKPNLGSHCLIFHPLLSYDFCTYTAGYFTLAPVNLCKQAAALAPGADEHHELSTELGLLTTNVNPELKPTRVARMALVRGVKPSQVNKVVQMALENSQENEAAYAVRPWHFAEKVFRYWSSVVAEVVEARSNAGSRLRKAILTVKRPLIAVYFVYLVFAGFVWASLLSSAFGNHVSMFLPLSVAARFPTLNRWLHHCECSVFQWLVGVFDEPTLFLEWFPHCATHWIPFRVRVLLGFLWAIGVTWITNEALLIVTLWLANIVPPKQKRTSFDFGLPVPKFTLGKFKFQEWWLEKPSPDYNRVVGCIDYASPRPEKDLATVIEALKLRMAQGQERNSAWTEVKPLFFMHGDIPSISFEQWVTTLYGRRDEPAMVAKWYEAHNAMSTWTVKPFLKTKAFVKDETYPGKVDKVKPRLVNDVADLRDVYYPTMTIAAIANSIKHAQLEAMSEGIYPRHVYVTGMDEALRGDWYAHYLNEGYQYALEVDISSFEASICWEALNLEFGVYQKLIAGHPNADLILKSFQMQRQVVMTYADKVYKRTAGRVSGVPNTSIGNSILNLSAIAHVLNQQMTPDDYVVMVLGDDSLVLSKVPINQPLVDKAYAILGWKSETKVSNAWDFQAEFCSGRFVPLPDTSLVWVEKCGKIMLKGIEVPHHVTNYVDYIAPVMRYYATKCHCPILRQWATLWTDANNIDLSGDVKNPTADLDSYIQRYGTATLAISQPKPSRAFGYSIADIDDYVAVDCPLDQQGESNSHPRSCQMYEPPSTAERVWRFLTRRYVEKPTVRAEDESGVLTMA